MSREDQVQIPRKTVRELIQTHQEMITNEYSLDSRRVLGVLTNTVRTTTGDPIANLDSLVAADQRLDFWPDLLEGIRYLSPEVTLELFETSDVDDLGNRVALTHELSGRYWLGQSYPLS